MGLDRRRRHGRPPHVRAAVGQARRGLPRRRRARHEGEGGRGPPPRCAPRRAAGPPRSASSSAASPTSRPWRPRRSRRPATPTRRTSSPSRRSTTSSRGGGSPRRTWSRRASTGSRSTPPTATWSAQFMSPLTNRRTDSFGGCFDNRMRFLHLVIEAMRSVSPAGFALGVRLSGEEEIPGGMGIDDCVRIAEDLAGLGAVDYFSITHGTPGHLRQGLHRSGRGGGPVGVAGPGRHRRTHPGRTADPRRGHGRARHQGRPRGPGRHGAGPDRGPGPAGQVADRAARARSAAAWASTRTAAPSTRTCTARSTPRSDGSDRPTVGVPGVATPRRST